MHRISIFGKTPGSLAQLAHLLRERQNLCQLEWYRLLYTEQDEEPGFSGPISKAPDGLYQLWHDSPGSKEGFFLVDLVILPDQFLLDQHVIQRLGTGWRLDESTRKSFHALLGQSEKVLVVYQRGTNQADRDYVMVWPDHVKHLVPEKGEYRLLGIANLETGVISART